MTNPVSSLSIMQAELLPNPLTSKTSAKEVVIETKKEEPPKKKDWEEKLEQIDKLN